MSLPCFVTRWPSSDLVDEVLSCAKYAGGLFKRQGFRNLIITSSMSGHIVNVPVDQPLYNGSKVFVMGSDKSLGSVWRKLTPINRVGKAYRMAALGKQSRTKKTKGLYLFLASDVSTYMTGSDVSLDGGYCLREGKDRRRVEIFTAT